MIDGWIESNKKPYYESNETYKNETWSSNTTNMQNQKRRKCFVFTAFFTCNFFKSIFDCVNWASSSDIFDSNTMLGPSKREGLREDFFFTVVYCKTT